MSGAVSDVVFLAGCGFVTVGLWMLHPAAALIAAGVMAQAIAVAVRMGVRGDRRRVD